MNSHRKRAKRSGGFLTIRKWLSGMAAAAVALTGAVALPTAANAATVYEINGSWQAETPDTLATGDIATSVWRFNMNDDAEAPGNAPLPNTTVTFTVIAGEFTVLPSACLVESDDPENPLDPVSYVSEDGATLVCNLGDRAEGTAELLLTGIKVTGATGDEVSVTGRIGNADSQTPVIPIVNEFRMDMKWDQGNPRSVQDGSYQVISFPWSLRHAPGAVAGPSSVEYEITISRTNGESVAARPALDGGSCGLIDRANPNHPYSSTTPANADNTNVAPSATCTMTQIGTSDRYRVSISNIDYSKTLVPVNDTNGTPLPVNWDVVASGMIYFRMNYVGPGTFIINANAPTYTSVSGDTYVDETNNNRNDRAYTRGTRTGGWVLALQENRVEGSIWTDTYRQMANGDAMAHAAIAAPSTGQTSEMCIVLDSKYVDFQWAGTGVLSGGVPAPYDGAQPTIKYFNGLGVGGVLDASSAEYNPNNWNCNSTLGNSNWHDEPTGTVRAVHVSFPAGTQIDTNLAQFYVMTKLKSDVQVGQDIYTWQSFRQPGNTNWAHPHRDNNINNMPGIGTDLGTDSRYRYTGAGRDVLRVVQAKPLIEKDAGQAETIPGATVPFTLKYRAQAPINATIPEFVIEDTLPEFTDYVAGSATTEPTSIETLPNGRVKLRWELNDIDTNVDYFMNYDIILSDEVEPGHVFKNQVSASIGNQADTSNANVRVRDGGFTFLTKTSHADTVPHDKGTASNGWTIRLTSEDTSRVLFTDTIDVLPVNGDSRGSQFSGSYKLSGPIAVSNMTDDTVVYYTTVDPATISDNPKHASNGAPGDITGNTVSWSTTFTEDATAVRVIGGVLRPSEQQSFTVNITTTGASHEDVYVNRAQTVTSRTNLVMRTSDDFSIAAVNSVALKKYVQSSTGDWHDAQNADDYPSYYQGDSAPYRLVITNTGDEPLVDVAVNDDTFDLTTLTNLPSGVTVSSDGLVIAELLPGEENQVVIEYQMPLAGFDINSQVVNTACAVPSDEEVDFACDPAGIKILPSSLAWEKVAAGTTENLAGSEWELQRYDTDGNQIGDPIIVTDCVADNADACTSADVDPREGFFLVGELNAGIYELTETKAPVGYKLDDAPHLIEVSGDTAFDMPIENEQQDGLVIPHTGGQSAQMFFLIAGGLAGTIALVITIRNRKARRLDSDLAATAM